jgi:hypothetical protein
MELIIHDRDVGAGEIVKAALRIRPMKDLHATSIEACLVMNEVPQTYSSVGQRATEFARTRLAQGGEIQAGYAVEFPIEIPLSYDLVPSRLGTYSEVIWKLKAMAHRRLLNDLWVTTNLNVYNENLIESLPGPSRPSGTRRRTRSSRS